MANFTPTIAASLKFAAQMELLLQGIRHPSTDAPLNGGYVHFYEAGTTTAKNAYTDVYEQNAITSVQLDAQGEAQVYGNGEYKLEIRDTDDSTVLLTVDYYRVRRTNQLTVLATGSAGDAPSDTEFTVDPGINVILVDTSANPVTLNWFAAADQIEPITVKKISGESPPKAVTIVPNGTETINGGASVSVSGENAVTTVIGYGDNLYSGSPSDADTVDGFHASQTPTADTIVVADSGGTTINKDWLPLATNTADKGAVVYATTAETITATEDAKAVTPDGLAGSLGLTDLTAGSVVLTSGGWTGLITAGQTMGRTAAASYTKVAEFMSLASGTITVYFQGISAISSGGGRIYVNGVAVGTDRTVGTSAVDFTENITVARGDLVQLYMKGNGGSYTYLLKFKATAAEDSIAMTPIAFA